MYAYFPFSRIGPSLVIAALQLPRAGAQNRCSKTTKRGTGASHRSLPTSLSIFLVTPAANRHPDPIGYGRPQHIAPISEIRRSPITDQVRTVQPHHFDHIAGGKPFKDPARFSAHKRAKERLVQLKIRHVIPINFRQTQNDPLGAPRSKISNGPSTIPTHGVLRLLRNITSPWIRFRWQFPRARMTCLSLEW